MKVDFKDFEIELKDDFLYRIKFVGNFIYGYEFFQGIIIKNLVFMINKRVVIVRDIGSKQEVFSVILCENGGKVVLI